mmetsp:Transcript_22059/g.77317  ORF Transcript_22059/g.77317 Transcript_22059/m.77317 type:complete len:491 (-) Transcript_22059:65-1537(-)
MRGSEREREGGEKDRGREAMLPVDTGRAQQLDPLAPRRRVRRVPDGERAERVDAQAHPHQLLPRCTSAAGAASRRRCRGHGAVRQRRSGHASVASHAPRPHDGAGDDEQREKGHEGPRVGDRVQHDGRKQRDDYGGAEEQQPPVGGKGEHEREQLQQQAAREHAVPRAVRAAVGLNAAAPECGADAAGEQRAPHDDPPRVQAARRRGRRGRRGVVRVGGRPRARVVTDRNAHGGTSRVVRGGPPALERRQPAGQVREGQQRQHDGRRDGCADADGRHVVCHHHHHELHRGVEDQERDAVQHVNAQRDLVRALQQRFAASQDGAAHDGERGASSEAAADAASEVERREHDESHHERHDARDRQDRDDDLLLRRYHRRPMRRAAAAQRRAARAGRRALRGAGAGSTLRDSAARHRVCRGRPTRRDSPCVHHLLFPVAPRGGLQDGSRHGAHSGGSSCCRNLQVRVPPDRPPLRPTYPRGAHPTACLRITQTC